MSVKIIGLSEQQWRNEHKKLLKELKETQTISEELKVKLSRAKDRLAKVKGRELSLMQTNRALIEVVKGYADREASIMACWKTLTQAYGDTE